MLHHRTDDPGERAWHIAWRESSRRFDETRNPDDFFITPLVLCTEVLRELVSEPIKQEECDAN